VRADAQAVFVRRQLELDVMSEHEQSFNTGDITTSIASHQHLRLHPYSYLHFSAYLHLSVQDTKQHM
jgi:hypothetical protein